MQKKLLSVSKFEAYFEFHPYTSYVKDKKTKAILLKGILDNGLYKFNMSLSRVVQNSNLSIHKSSISTSIIPTSFIAYISSLDLWHQRFAHASNNVVKHTLSHYSISYSDSKCDIVCNAYKINRSHKL